MRKVLSLTPLIVFLALYLGVSLATGDFYRMPLIVAFLFASVYAILICVKLPLKERIRHFSHGAGNPDMLIMVWIFMLAGAFSASAKAVGAIDAATSVVLTLLPSKFILPGFFLAACFISLSVGTSVGTIVALVPIAAGVADEIGCSLPLMLAAVVGGAYFGDNLSFISDTTIIATQSQGCKMRDKFLFNFRIALPAAIVVFALYAFLGRNLSVTESISLSGWYNVFPYLIVFACALAGVNVMAVLGMGIISTLGLMFFHPELNFFDWIASLNAGVLNMSELIIITMLAGGMVELMRVGGGLEWITARLVRHIRNKRGAEFCIALIVMLADICTANNTVAILSTGSIAKHIATRYNIDSRRSASLLDIFGCVTQGCLPYGAQLVMVSGLTGIAAMEVIPYLYYPFVLGISGVISIICTSSDTGKETFPLNA